MTIPAAAPAFAGTSYTTTTAYNVDGTPKTTSLPAVGGLPAEHLKYSYDGLGNYSGLYGTQEYGAITYTAIGQVAQYARDAPTGGISDYTAYGYDPATGATDEIKDETINGSTFTTVADRNYTRDDAGQITKAANTLSSTSTDTQCYSYDHLQQLTQAWTPAASDCTTALAAGALGGPAPYWQTYTYDDATGNRKTVTQHATTTSGSDTTNTYSYQAAGNPQPHAVAQVQTQTGTAAATAKAFNYDAAGNATTLGTLAASYNPAGKTATITTGGTTQTDIYDADGNLLLQTDAKNGATLYLGDTELHQAPGSTAVSVSRTYAMGSAVLAERDAAAGSSTSTLYWVTGDVDGSPDLEVNTTTGAVTHRYTDPFGNRRGPTVTWSSDRGFLNDPDSTVTGLTQIGARLYDSATGAFTTADPLLAADSFASRNPYAYAGNSPVSNSDPTGECLEVGDALSFRVNCGMGHGVTAPSATLVASVKRTAWERGTAAGKKYIRSFTRPKREEIPAAPFNCAHLGACSSEYLTPQEQSQIEAGEDEILIDTLLVAGDALMLAATAGAASALVPGEFAGNAAASETIADGELTSEAAEGPAIAKPYSRPSGATTSAQRAAVQGRPCVDCGQTTERQVADHIDPLVNEYYRTGSIDLERMRSLDAVQPQCPTCSARQGAELSRYSVRIRNELFGPK